MKRIVVIGGSAGGMMAAIAAAEQETNAEVTVVTKDRSLSAHFEHTVVVGDNRAEILTRNSPEGKKGSGRGTRPKK